MSSTPPGAKPPLRRKRLNIPPPPNVGTIPAGLADPDVPGRRFPVPTVLSNPELLDKLDAAADLQKPQATGEAPGSGVHSRLMTIPLALLDDSPEQARGEMRESFIEELAASIAESGLLEPIKVRPSPTTPGRFETIAGHHRRRAMTLLGRTEIDALVELVDERQAKAAHLVTNDARRKLSDWERAKYYYAALNTEPKIADNQRQLAKLVARSEASISVCVAMLRLPEPIQRLLDGQSQFMPGKLAAEVLKLLSEHPECLDDIVAEAEALYDAYGTPRYRADPNAFRGAVLGRIGRRKATKVRAPVKAYYPGADGAPALTAQIKGKGVLVMSPKGAPPELMQRCLAEALKAAAIEIDRLMAEAPGSDRT